MRKKTVAFEPELKWILSLVVLLIGQAPSVSFGVEEIEVTPAPIFDFEFDFDAANGRFAWTGTQTGELWVGYVDPSTGEFSPLNGKAELVDLETVLPGNGPEWVATQTGTRLVYTKRPLGAFAGLSQAEFDGATWHPEEIPFGSRRILPIGSTDLSGLPAAILSFVLSGATGQASMVWRFLDLPGIEKLVPGSQGATGGRWVPGRREIVFSAPIDGGRQVFLYDGLTDSTEQLTFDNGRKQTVFMWEAPEFPGEFIFFASVKGAQQSQIRVYRLLDEDEDGEFEWTIIKTINPPTTGIYFWSPEPFVHNGTSYIFWVASSQPDQPDPAFPSQVWMAAADPADSYFVSLSDPTLSRFRVDPEVFVTDQGPYLYYNLYLPGSPQQYEGVYRIDTELGPVLTQP